MADVFLKSDAVSLLKDKYVLFIGDSNVRALYKDLLWLYKCNTLIDIGFLRRRVSKLEQNFLGDSIIHRSELTKGRDFTEHRLFQDGKTRIEFLFVTRCFSTTLESLFNDIKDKKRPVPDVVCMNSCLWDVCRWGPNGVKEYKVNMVKLMKFLLSVLPPKTLFIWGTALPTASKTSGGLIIKQIEFIQAALRVHIIEANKFAASLVSSYGFDVLDFHHYMHFQVTRRSADGIHFLPPAMRFLTNLLLTHIALSWDVKLPGRLNANTYPLETLIEQAIHKHPQNVEGIVKKIDDIASNLNSAANEGNAILPKNKKNKGKNKKGTLIVKTIINNKIQIGPPNTAQPSRSNSQGGPKTPQMYQKAQKRQNFNGSWLDPNGPKDFRLLGFEDFSHSSIDDSFANRNWTDNQFARDVVRPDSYPMNSYNGNMISNHSRNVYPSNAFNYNTDPCSIMRPDMRSGDYLRYPVAYQGNLNYDEVHEINYRHDYRRDYNYDVNNYRNDPVQKYDPRVINLINNAFTILRCSNPRAYGSYNDYDQRFGIPEHYGYSDNNPNRRFGPIRSRAGRGTNRQVPYQRPRY